MSRLRNVLTVMGCDAGSYWLGTFLGDFALFSVTAVALWVTMPAAVRSQEDDLGDLDQWEWGHALFYFVPLFGLHICAFSYAASFGALLTNASHAWAFVFTCRVFL